MNRGGLVTTWAYELHITINGLNFMYYVISIFIFIARTNHNRGDNFLILKGTGYITP